MTLNESGFLDAFPGWLQSLADDARSLSALLEESTISQPARLSIASALNYLFKSLDLIPDGIEDLGFIDDAFVFRVAVAQARAADPGIADKDQSGAVQRLSDDSALVKAFLQGDFERLDRFVRGLKDSVVRGRAAQDVLEDAEVRDAFQSEVAAWASSYDAPKFGREEKNLVKLRSFLGAKLPS